MTTQYKPREGSVCGKALAAIRAHGKRLSEDAIGIAMDLEVGEVASLLAYPLRLGAITRTKDDQGIVWYDEGDDIPPLAPPAPAPAPVPVAEKRLASAMERSMADAAERAANPPRLESGARLAGSLPDVPQFIPSRRPRAASAPERAAAAPAELDEVLVGGAGPALLPVSPRAPAIYPLDAEHSFEISIPNKANARITLPAEFDARDWKLLQAVMTAYANRLAPVAA